MFPVRCWVYQNFSQVIFFSFLGYGCCTTFFFYHVLSFHVTVDVESRLQVQPNYWSMIAPDKMLSWTSNDGMLVLKSGGKKLWPYYYLSV